MKELINFPYINGSEIVVSTNSVHLNSSWVHPDIYPQYDSAFVWDLDVIQTFVDRIEDNDVILDIGANSGTFSLAAKYYPTTKWYSFEPDPFNTSLLEENLKLNNVENVVLYDHALSDNLGEDILKICPSHHGLNTLGKNLERFSENDSIDHLVKTNTIDNLFLDTKIDLIKMDTEGSEYDIIVGGKKTIKKYKPIILLEYNADNIRQCGHNMQKLNDLFSELNYTPCLTMGENLFIQPK
tara:strand:- start:5854 stop:6573 length:720 start_codon:yes stop_codon:yes gene_type:complete